MEQKQIIKKMLITKTNTTIHSIKYKSKNLELKPMIKGDLCSKVFKCATLIKTQIIIKTPKSLIQPRLKIQQKLKITKLNQANIIYHYKRKQLFNANIKAKNVFWLNKKKNKLLKMMYLLFIGLFIGFINGFWGGGGGMICVPTLTMLLKMPDKKAHATTILIMLPLSIASFVVYMLKGTIEWQTAGFVSGGFILGGIAGALILKKINNTFLRVVFSLVIIAGAIKMLF